MRLSVITDEISDDIVTALGVVESLGVSAVEIRVVDGRNIVHHPAESWRRLAAMLGAGGFHCPVVDSPFLKTSPQPGDPDWTEPAWTELERAIEAAAVLGAGTVRVFSGRRRAAPDTAWLVDTLARAADRTHRAGLGMAIEVEHVCVIATAAEAAAMAARASGLEYILDPGNESCLTREPADTALIPALAARIRHVHVKDVDATGSWVRVGTGIVGWRDQLAALRDVGYDGYLSIETHYATPSGGLTGATRESVRSLRELARAAGIDLS